MKKLAVSIIILAVVLPLAVYFCLSPLIEPHRHQRIGRLKPQARGLEVLELWAAWPVLAFYGTPLLALAAGLGWLGGHTRRDYERYWEEKRKKDATDRMREANRLTAEAKRARELDQAIVTNVKRDNMHLSRQAGKDRGQRINAVGELKRRREREGKLREELAEAHREIERLKHALPPESETQ